MNYVKNFTTWNTTDENLIEEGREDERIEDNNLKEKEAQ